MVGPGVARRIAVAIRKGMKKSRLMNARAAVQRTSGRNLH
jgi:hypothetical protein